MQPRQYRAGDALDDYCPRERRVTEHAVVALVEGAVERTRCVACDVEHEYRHGRAPATRRAKSPTAALYAQVLEGLEVPSGRVTPAPPPPLTRPAPAPETSAPGAETMAASAPEPVARRRSPARPVDSAPAPEAVPAAAAPTPEPPAAVPSPTSPADAAAPDAEADDRPFRRTLLRAQLPRHEGQVATTRTIPEFTMHQPPPPRGQRHRRFGGRPAAGFEGPMRSSRDFSHSQGREGRGPAGPPPQGQAPAGQGAAPGGGQGRRRRRRRKKAPAQG